MTRAPKLFRTPHTFDTPEEAINFFTENRVEGVEELPPEVCDFLAAVAVYDPEAVYNVQPGMPTNYVAVAQPTDRSAWFYAKPAGVMFCVGDTRNVEAVLDTWDEAQDSPEDKQMLTDVWFPSAALATTAAQFCLRLAAAWAS